MNGSRVAPRRFHSFFDDQNGEASQSECGDIGDQHRLDIEVVKHDAGEKGRKKKAGRLRQLVESAGLGVLFLGKQIGNRCLVGGILNADEEGAHRHADIDVPQLWFSEQHERQNEHQADRGTEIADDHHEPAVEAVGQDAAKRTEQEGRHKRQQNDQSGAGSHLRALEGVHAQRKAREPAADHGQELPAPDRQKLAERFVLGHAVIASCFQI